MVSLHCELSCVYLDSMTERSVCCTRCIRGDDVSRVHAAHECGDGPSYQRIGYMLCRETSGRLDQHSVYI